MLGLATPSLFAYKDMKYTKQKQEDFWYLVNMSRLKKYDLPPALSVSVAMQESQFNRRALSPAGAVSIMQIMPRTGEGECGMPVEQLWEPLSNMRCGLRILKEYRESLPRRMWSSLPRAYNQGIGATLKGQSYYQSRDYEKRVQQTRKRYWESSPHVVVKDNTLQMFGETFKLKNFKLASSRYQLSVYVSRQWTRASNIKVFDLYPLTEAGNSTYYLAKEPKESFILANNDYKQYVGKNLPLISAFRETTHNEVVGGAKESNHKKGISIDLDFNQMTIKERNLATKLLAMHGFKPLKNVLYSKKGVLQPEDNHFDYKYKKANAGAVVTSFSRNNFTSDYAYARFQFLLDIARATGFNYVDFYINQ